jgi:hypothetical protein
MKSPSTAALAGVMLLAACAGREANPVSEYRPGDDEKSCQRLQSEIEQIDAEIRAMLPDTDKTGQNVALGVAGAFLIVPWFFMDFSEAEKIEVKALRRRYNHLVLLGREKDCGFGYEEIPPLEEGALPTPSPAGKHKPA